MIRYLMQRLGLYDDYIHKKELEKKLCAFKEECKEHFATEQIMTGYTPANSINEILDKYFKEEKE